MKKPRFKRPVYAVVGMEDGELCILGLYFNSEEANEHRDRVVNERFDLVRKTLETTARVIKRPLEERNVNSAEAAVNQSYTVVELNLDSPNKQVIWSFE